MPQNLRKSMVLDGIAASEAIDSSGEILDIKGLDISSLQDGSGVLNYEHRGDTAEGASANDIIGHITFAKKIFGAEDCDNERELGYWNKVQLPFVYIQAELFNDEGHPGAVAAASLIRYYEHRKLPILMRYSIEGSTLDRDGNKLKRAVAKRVAATIKPCNRSCISGVLSDGVVAEEKKKDALDELKRSETRMSGKFRSSYLDAYQPIVSDPLAKMRAAIEDLREFNDMQKALSAGGFNAAPTSLTGGSALMAENFGDTEKRKKFIKNQVMAAMRDWRGKGDVRKFLKHRMPDTSPEFIEHFAGLVEDYQLKKFAELEDDLNKKVSGKGSAVKATAATPLAGAPKKPVKNEGKAKKLATVEAHHAKVKAAHDDSVEDLPEDKLGDHPLTLRGRHMKANPQVVQPVFDERKGILHTNRGSFKMYLPQHDKYPGALDSFHNALNDPKATHFHDYAVSNWLKVHKLLKEGKLPPEVIMHSTLFSQLSPNTPVPMQELMYSHLVDAMKQTGVDARSPEFARIKQNWTDRDKPKNYPDHAQDYFTDNKGVHLKHNAKPGTTGRVAGDVGSFMLANNKFKNMAQYHSLHGSLVDLFARHKHDARSAVSELMNHKHQAGLWDAKRERDIGRGLVDPGDYAMGPNVPGLAPKTGRYMAAMVGGGNVHVPDTHFTRYLFGLEKGTDARSIAYLKNVLWSPNNSHILDGIDRFYAQNHPAVQHMMDHPVFGKHFESREDAVFPAFWKNWIAIAPHERARKMKTMAYNEATDHRPFWEAINPFMKGELPMDKSDSVTLPMQTAQLHHKWIQQFGEIPAQMLYYAHIVPQLLRASRRNEDVIVKMQRIAEDLNKMQQQQGPVEPPLPPLAAPNTNGLHEYKGKHIKPGEIEVVAGPYKGSKFHYLGKDQGKHHVKTPEGEHHAFSSLMEGKAFKVVSEPQDVQMPLYVDATQHDGGSKRYSQKSLMHGVDLENKHSGLKASSLTSGLHETGWYRNHAGNLGLVKPNVEHDDWMWPTKEDPEHPDNKEYLAAQHSYSLSDREALYPTMARDFFGLGDHVPETAKFKHPKTGKLMSIQARVVGGNHVDMDDDDHAAALHQLGKSGHLDKLVLMDWMMGNNDRHQANFMMTAAAPHVHLIDNGLALDYKGALATPHLWDAEHEMNHHLHQNIDFAADHQLHPEAMNWLMGLDAKGFAEKMRSEGVPERLVQEGHKRMLAMQLAAAEARLTQSNMTRGRIASVVDALNGYQNRWDTPVNLEPAANTRKP